jgi:prolipoprotein diacylglyceryltransferase
MASILFLTALTTFFAILFYWGFRHLPAAEWQIMATVPSGRNHDGSWRGLNLTYYGLFNATACVFSCALIFSLMAALNVSNVATAAVTAILLLVCLPSAKILARLIERKPSTFTIGGASFVGIVLLPWIIQLFNAAVGSRVGLKVPVVQMLGAAAIAYAFGEAFGRLACISFGCCYGKVIWHLPVHLQNAIRSFCFVFEGETKKVAYEGDLVGTPVVPIQAVTAIISTLAGLAGLYFFLTSAWIAAAIIPLVVTQAWRVLSEIFRADFRGRGKLSVYQIMALVSLVYACLLLSLLHPTVTNAPEITIGLRNLLNTPMLVLLEVLWLGVFLYMGRSSVTGATISFHVVRKQI